jgi:SH3-like domain-containing protein
MRRLLFALAVITLISCGTSAPSFAAYPAVIVGAEGVQQVRLWPGPTDRSRTVAVLTPGDTVTVVDVAGDQLHIRTAGGVEGWLNQGFVKKQ